MAAAPPGAGLPSLNLSSGPAISDAASGGNSVTFGPFFEGQRPSLVQQVLPWAMVGGVLWLVLR